MPILICHVTGRVVRALLTESAQLRILNLPVCFASFLLLWLGLIFELHLKMKLKTTKLQSASFYLRLKKDRNIKKNSRAVVPPIASKPTS